MKVTSLGYNKWKVQVLFEEQNTEEIKNRLGDVKAELARQFGVPDQLLQYTRMLGREQTEHGTSVVIEIVKRTIPCGAPQFRLLPMTAPDGTVFTEMLLEVDLFPLDEFEQFVSFQTVQSHASMSGVEMTQIAWSKIQDALNTMSQTCEPVLGLVVATGEFPDFGISSQIHYSPLNQELGVIQSAWIGAHAVSQGEILVETSPARPGRKPGRNLLGRELEPRPGIETRLEPGDGTRLGSGGHKVIATRNGVVTYKRVGLNRHSRDSRDSQPGRLIVSVLPVTEVQETQKFDIESHSALMIRGNVLSGSQIRSRAPIVIEGNVLNGSRIETRSSLRVLGDVSGSYLSSDQHLSLYGNAHNSHLIAKLSVQLDGRVVDSTVRAMDVLALEIIGGDVEALSRTSVSRVNDSETGAASVRINVRKYLEEQEESGRRNIEDIRATLGQMIQIFGPQIVSQVEAASLSRTLLQWMRGQKSVTGLGYTNTEVHDYRALLETVPILREQLAAAGMELREITQRLQELDRAESRMETCDESARYTGTGLSEP